MALMVLAGCGGTIGTPRAALPSGVSFAMSQGALMVARQGQPFTYSEGLPATRAARAYCAAQGGRLHPAALGRFAGGTWIFQGGCA